MALTPKEFKVLRYFVSRVGRALTRDEIMAAAWGSDILVTSRSVDRCIATLRGKIEPDPHRTIAEAGQHLPLRLDCEERLHSGGVLLPDSLGGCGLCLENGRVDPEEGGVAIELHRDPAIVIQRAERPGAPGPLQFPALASK